MHKLSVLFAAGVALTSAANAQDMYQWTAPQQQSGHDAPLLQLSIGTPVTLATRTRVSTKDDLKTGQRVFLTVMEDVSYNGQVLIPAGSPAFGEIEYVESNGHFGKRGSVGVTLSYVQTPYGPVQLSGQRETKGHSGTALSVATIALVSPWGFVIHGTSAKMEAMTPIQGYLASPLRFTEQKPQQAADARVVQPDQTRGASTAVASR